MVLILQNISLFMNKSIQRHILKIRRIAAGFLVVELINAHVGFLDFLGAIAEGVGDMHGDGHDDDHFGCKHRAVHSFDPLGPYFEYLTHDRNSLFVFFQHNSFLYCIFLLFNNGIP